MTQKAKISKADIRVKTSPQGYPTICIPITNSYGIAGVIQKVFNNEDLMQRCRNLIKKHYEEPRASQALLDLDRRQENQVEIILERLAMEGDVNTARYVINNIDIDIVYRTAQNITLQEEGEDGEVYNYSFKDKVLSHSHFQLNKYADIWEYINKIT
jgi:hypothetical protein